MEVKIVEKVENQLFQRLEIKFVVNHTDAPTPKRLDVRAQLASQLGVQDELVVVEKLSGAYGKQTAFGRARVYSSKDRLQELEPKYLLQRGMPKEKKPEEKVEKPKAKPEKPKEVEKSELKEKSKEAIEGGEKSQGS